MNDVTLALASLPSWWMTAAIVTAVAAALVIAYRRPIIEMPRAKVAALVILRVTAVVALVVIVMRPVARRPSTAADRAVVPILVDMSRSMRIADADGVTRRARADAVVQFELMPALASKFVTPIVSVGDAHRSDLAAAVASARDQFRGQRVAGVVLVSDGADTGSPDARAEHSVPVMAIGVGSPAGLRDREVVSIAKGDQRLTDASVDIEVSAASSGFGRAPYEIRLLASGAVVEARRVSPSAAASPDRVRFTVSPDPARATIYTAEIPPAPGEGVTENNTRGILIEAAGRRRRLLVIAGAPGFEHSFMTRAWALDAGLEVDSVVRKGRNADGHDTFVIQAPADRAPALSAGLPQRREDLYAYDALALANIEGEFFTRAQLAMVADFVGERGGGLLVAGSRSLTARGVSGTPLDAVLPVDLDSRAGVARAMFTPGTPGAPLERGAPNQLVVTADGETHPIMRLGTSTEDTRAKWASLPPLASWASLGPARPGASVLAVVSSPDGGVFPAVAVEPYGRGRTMVFGGEASWRWRMLASSSDRSHELFWRQAARWLSTASPDPVSVSAPASLEPGDTGSIEIVARDASFIAVPDAKVTATVSVDGGAEQPLAARRADGAGHFAAVFSADRPGLYRIHADAVRGAVRLGAADRTIYVGGSDREFADPRLNEGVLRRLARDSGGRYVRASDASQVLSWLDEAAKASLPAEQRDVWNTPWLFAFVVGLLGAEWTLRRRWGLR